MSEIREDYLPGCGYKIYQDPAEFTFTTDSVFLAHFPHLANKAKVLELGCGTGAISFYLAARGAVEVTGLDVNPRMVELFNRSAEANGIFWQEEAETGATEMKAEVRKRGVVSVTDDSVPESKKLAPKVHALEWDIKEIKSFCPTEAFDLVVANPPYRNSGRERTIGTRYNLQPKKLQWVHASVDKPAWIFLLEMVKNGSYGLEVLPPLIMYNADGTLTEQAKRQMEKD